MSESRVSSPARLAREFNELMEFEMPTTPSARQLDILARKVESMLDSEVAELKQALARRSLDEVSRELADIVYVAYGVTLELGIDLDGWIANVHQANLTRKSRDGHVHKRSDGKVLKGNDYDPPLPMYDR